MKRLKRRWMEYSIKWKIAILVMLMAVITLASEGLMTYLGISTLNEYETVMDDNSIYHELQNVLKEEQETFLSYIRERSDENKIAFDAACRNSEECVDALSFDFHELGEERYARTWNVVNGYHGYMVYRDQILARKETDGDYTRILYEVLGMQESLSDSALKLGQVTLEQWNHVYEEQRQLFQMMPVFVTCTVVLIVCVVIFCWRMISDSIIRPLLLIAEDSRRIAVNQFDTLPLQVENRDEIGELFTAFNRMKHTMGDYISTLKEKNRVTELLHKEEMEKLELEKRFDQTRMEVLKHQVNPHFLFNTLNMISSMAELEDAKTTNSMIRSLANLFRYSLRTVEQEVYLEQELDALDEYIYIQQMRFDDRIVYEKCIQVNAEEVRIPSFTLQPIVENAFVHGVAAMESGGRILVWIRQTGTSVVIEITDNGFGMEEEQLQRLNENMKKTNTSGRGIGLGNICRRIDMMYPDGDMHVYSTKGQGTTVRLVIPQRQGES